MNGQSPCTLINEYVHRLFCETKKPRSLITQQEFLGKSAGLALFSIDPFLYFNIYGEYNRLWILKLVHKTQT